MTRDEQMLQLRRDGKTLREIGTLYGVSAQRVSQILDAAVFTGTCPCCGKAFSSGNAMQVYCGSCTCQTCGKLVPRRRARPGNPFCRASCEPGHVFKGAAGGATFRRVEPGIYVKRYKTTGIKPGGFYCFDQNASTFVRFDEIDEARAYRASRAWSKSRAA